MEATIKKYQQKFRKVKQLMGRWEELQSRLVSQFANASLIIERLQVLQNSKHYGNLSSVEGIKPGLLQKQMDSLQTILLSMKKTMEDFHGLVLSLEGTYRDGKQLVKGGSTQLSKKQMQQTIGLKPSVSDCLEGLMLLYETHNSEYCLKSSLVTALSALALKSDTSDLGALRQLLVDQPNICKDEGLLPESSQIICPFSLTGKAREHLMPVLKPPYQNLLLNCELLFWHVTHVTYLCSASLMSYSLRTSVRLLVVRADTSPSSGSTTM